MKIIEYGNKDNPVIMMIHGGGLSWWNYREEAQMLSDSYYVLLPVIEGHAYSNEPFISIENSAQKLIQYINNNLNGKIKALCGLSLGAQIAVEMIAQKNDICDYSIIESVSLIPSKFTEKLIGPTFSMSYRLIKQNWFSKIQFKSLHINKTLYDDYYKDTCLLSKDDMISFLKANTKYELKKSICNSNSVIRVIVGGKEQRNMIRSARMLCDNLKNGTLEIKEGLYHGEYSLNKSTEYVNELLELVKDK